MTKLAKDETIISIHRLEELEKKERSHDAYLWATRRMADRVRSIQANVGIGTSGEFSDGYTQGLTDFARLVVEAP